MVDLLSCNNSVPCYLSFLLLLGLVMVVGLGHGDLNGNMQGERAGNRPLKKV